ncbi:hypothetical protein MPNT_190004 [Candidatus Methylacidithermus pantelleriae]|uniref:Uncharacterized protein n=1 Tax=Candidatus Methylacidithermus pantelleriae TaxID=2744239 RepID=A0A8J2BRX3_9BACT|nr:hypothetical protein MPNT_190004 [Candidatus Methylacidithermus pantelleriae]
MEEKGVCEPRGLEEGLAGGVRQPLLCARIQHETAGNPSCQVRVSSDGSLSATGWAAGGRGRA